MSDTTVRKYGVGRGRKIVGTLFESVEEAQQELAWYEGQMVSVALKPDVKVMYVDVTTSTSAPKVWSPEPDPEPDNPEVPVDAPVEDTATTATA